MNDVQTAITAAAVIAAAWALATWGTAQAMAAPGGDFAEPDQMPDTFDSFTAAVDPMTYYTGAVDAGTASTNERAFLDMIAFAEGTAGPRGYQTMFGYRYFDSFADHPRQYFAFTDLAGRNLKSSAAGRYQIIVKTWDALKAKLGLMDFSPDSQDRAALELIRERGALADVQAGRIESAVNKCRATWASLPGAGYAQPERSMTDLLAQFQNSGGSLA